MGCCAACASSTAAEIMFASAGTTVVLSRLFTYYMSRKIGNRLKSKGAELGHTLESMKMYGIPMESVWPLRHHMENREPPISVMMEAEHYKIVSYESTNTELFKQNLLSGKPIIIGLHTGRKFWNLKGPVATQEYEPINISNNRHSRGHAVTVVGYDDNIRGGSWIIANSLGLPWGDRGLGALPYTCNKDIGESFIITGISLDGKFLKIDK
jgi:hypothetical protein